jgi:hypothetical protein
MAKCTQLLDYLVYHADAKVRFYASHMIMNIHLDALYFSKGNACSKTCGQFFMGWMPQDDAPICINSAFHVSTNVIRFVITSAAKAELGALFHNCQTGFIFHSILKDMGHKQTKTPVHCDNATAVVIANRTVKRQHSRLMEMRFFWISDKCAQEMYTLHWHPEQENLADYQSKHHTGAHHAAVCPWYLHEPNSPLLLPRAKAPSALKGCVGTLDDKYLRKVPLPRALRIQSPGHMTCAAVTERVKSDTCWCGARLGGAQSNVFNPTLRLINRKVLR